MLQTLRIRNLALLEEVTLDFEEGFTAVTGETGAGKSILLGALSLLAGERADKSVIRQGEPTCEVEASLWLADSSQLDAILQQLDLPPCEEGVLILKRSLSREKAPRITVNGSPAPLTALQQLGEHWIDFHGPNEPRRLLKDSCQLELLDLYGRHGDVLAAYREAYDTWRARREELRQLREETRLGPDQIDFLRNQLTRLDSVNLEPDALQELERDFQRMDQSQELGRLTGELQEGLAGDDGILGRLAGLVRQAAELSRIDPGAVDSHARLEAAAVELNDLAEAYSQLGASLQLDPEQAEALAERMNTWLELKRRYGGTIESVRSSREELRRKLAAQEDLDGAVAKLEQQIASAEREVRQRAGTLRKARQKAADQLARDVGKRLQPLGFKKAEFAVRLVDLAEPGPTGDCGAEYQFSPNVGEEPLPLQKIASSGELARVMLALKTLLADLDDIPVLVFDEVDANVGGEIGKVLGAKLGELADGRQVLCVTHLPQVAAQASCHLVVEKDQSGKRAVVTIRPIQIDAKERVGELARMLGDRNATSAQRHAEELLKG